MATNLRMEYLKCVKVRESSLQLYNLSQRLDERHILSIYQTMWFRKEIIWVSIWVTNITVSMLYKVKVQMSTERRDFMIFKLFFFQIFWYFRFKCVGNHKRQKTHIRDFKIMLTVKKRQMAFSVHHFLKGSPYFISLDPLCNTKIGKCVNAIVF